MRAAVIVFPGSNCDRDLVMALRDTGADVSIIWHKETEIPTNFDLIAIPGGFSFGDYLRCGAIAAKSPICEAVLKHANKGGYVLGICNGFQILIEMGLIPGALMRNSGLKFLCKTPELKVETQDSAFTANYSKFEKIKIPVAHHDGNYFLSEKQLGVLRDEDRIAFSYLNDLNGSVDGIAGVLSSNRRILGMMPHPERAMNLVTGSTDGQAFFRALVELTGTA
ncbi:MAG: phosphoribosylformylglycinamidine synthase subunit PurQ [Planktomarina sp.]|nr:phosphoribosylformylglycinamidine synthase subunit PurQ [Planktomarina sp.]